MVKDIRNILVGMSEEGIDEPSSALGYAIALASQSGAHVTVQAASLKLVLTHAYVSTAAANLVAAHNRRLKALAGEVAERARGDAAAAGVAASVESPQLSYGQMVDAFIGQAKVHDLAILDAETATINVDRGLIEGVLFESGRPLIVVPANVTGFAARKIIVAWDASARAARAVNDAMPFLRAAEAVEIVAVGSERELATSIPGAELAPHLVRHGVNATVKNLAVQGDVASTLREQASLFGADLLVMGAFHHSLMREWVLGGVTQSLLAESKVPLFLSY